MPTIKINFRKITEDHRNNFVPKINKPKKARGKSFFVSQILLIRKSINSKHQTEF